jgi:hypothetical protein
MLDELPDYETLYNRQKSQSEYYVDNYYSTDHSLPAASIYNNKASEEIENLSDRTSVFEFEEEIDF